MLCLATAENGIGGETVIASDEGIDEDTDDAKTLFGGAGANDIEIDCVVVLLGVEHTIDCFIDNELLVDIVDVVKSILVARTGVGFTGYKKSIVKVIEFQGN